MAGVNKVILVGNLGREPEVKHASNGTAIANLAIATSESWKDKNTGEKVEKTEWHRVSVFGKLAEIAGQYLHKGSKVLIDGRLKLEQWTDSQGQKRSKHKIDAESVQMLESKPKDGQTADHTNHPPQNRPAANQAPRQTPPPAQPQPAPKFPDMGQPDEIPF